MYETLRPRRGHDFLPPPDQLAVIPGLYAQDGLPATVKLVHLHLFAHFGDWWITELDREQLLAFGYVRLAAMPECAEWGYIDLTELEAVTDSVGNPVERDLYWVPVPVAAVEQIPAVG